MDNIARDQKHRVIGILHTLRTLKNEGLIDEDTLYPDDAVDDLATTLLRTASRWYEIGARRGAEEVIRAILAGKIKIHREPDGTIRIKRTKTNITWRRTLHVTVGNQKGTITAKKYRINLKDLKIR